MLSLRTVTVISLITLAACQDQVTTTTPDGASGTHVGAEGFATRGTPGTGWILDESGAPMEVTFEVHDGRAIFEGDIDLGPAAEIPATREALQRSRTATPGLRLGVTINGSRWPSGRVGYIIDPNLPMQYRVTDAMAHIEANNPGVKFEPRYYHTDYIYITRSTGCSSPVGRKGGRQTINLADGCGTGSAIHELMHSLGMSHEQSRCDRESFVQILLQNVESGREHNFERRCSGYMDVYGYDESSIMHYGPYDFSANGQPTIRSRRGLDHLMGQRSGMSGADVSTVHWMYPPPLSLVVAYPGDVPTLSWAAVPTATSYEVYRVETSYQNDQSGTRTWESRAPLGTTTGTSIQDPVRIYTGTSRCDYSGPNELAWVDVEYELVARFSSGQTRTTRAEAQVAVC